MKNVLIVLLIGCSGCLCSQQVYRYQPLTVVTVHNPMTPLPILDHFARNFPGVIPYWGVEGRNYVARYVDPSTSLARKLTYDRYGEVQKEEYEVNIEDCPLGLQAYCYRNYPSENPTVWSCQELGTLRYYVKRPSGTLWFDKDGNFLRRRRAWL